MKYTAFHCRTDQMWDFVQATLIKAGIKWNGGQVHIKRNRSNGRSNGSLNVQTVNSTPTLLQSSMDYTRNHADFYVIDCEKWEHLLENNND